MSKAVPGKPEKDKIIISETDKIIKDARALSHSIAKLMQTQTELSRNLGGETIVSFRERLGGLRAEMGLGISTVDHIYSETERPLYIRTVKQPTSQIGGGRSKSKKK
jgi:hypothetical protein